MKISDKTEQKTQFQSLCQSQTLFSSAQSQCGPGQGPHSHGSSREAEAAAARLCPRWEKSEGKAPRSPFGSRLSAVFSEAGGCSSAGCRENPTTEKPPSSVFRTASIPRKRKTMRLADPQTAPLHLFCSQRSKAGGAAWQTSLA